MAVAALILAAGAGRRMRGRDKLLERVDGGPLLRAVATAALDGGAAPVVVVLPPDAPARVAALDGLPVEVVAAADWAEGMAASLRAGVGALGPRAAGAVVLLGDMPEVRAADVARVIAAFDPAAGRGIVRAVAEDGTPGHPVLFGRRHFAALGQLAGDAGARALLATAAGVATVTVPGAAVDLDTPEEWAAWRAGRRPPG